MAAMANKGISRLLTVATLRRLSRFLGVLVVFSFVLSVVANGMWAKARLGAEIDSAGGLEGLPVEEIVLDKPAIDLLPENVLTYETIGRQQVPGQGDRAAEAIFATLSMNLEALVSINVYARVEGLATSEEAEGRVREAMAEYSVRQADKLLNGVTPAKTGYRQDEGAWVVMWTKGQYLVMVKGAFSANIPAERRDFLERQTLPVAEGVDLFQRTGRARASTPLTVPGGEAQPGTADSPDTTGTGAGLPSIDEIEGAEGGQ